ALGLVLLVVGCSTPAPPPPPTLTVPTPVPTVAPASRSVDYRAITQPLLLPLGALIVAVRANTPTSDYWFAEFDKAADTVLPAIEGDSSPTATRLRTGIANIRAMPKNLQVLEENRSALLQI